MISGFVVKLVVGLALAGVVLIEAFSPVVARVQLDGTAATAVHEALVELDAVSDERAKNAAAREAAEGNAVLEKFEVIREPTGPPKVRITLYRRAFSLFLKNWDRTTKYYDVRITTEASRGA